MPVEILEAILGLLDRDTLCTACLVSRTFCTAASAHICSLKLQTTPPAFPVIRFPRVTSVSAHHSDEDGSLAQVDPGLQDRITSVTVHYERAGSIRETLSQLALIPRLRELNVTFNVRGCAGVLRACTNLESIMFGDCGFSCASTLMTFTSLTSLHIGTVYRPGDVGLRADVSWLRQGTNLTNLQVLRIRTPKEGLPLIGNLTGLTELDWFYYDPRDAYTRQPVTFSISPLTRLTRLRCLDVAVDGGGLSERNVAIACSLGAGALTKLRLIADEQASPDCGRFVMRQTALRQLSVGGQQLCDFRHIGALRIELLQSLELYGLTSLDDEGALALRKATAVTNLFIGTKMTQRHMGLTHALAMLTQLRTLSLYMYADGVDTKILDFPLALCPLAAVTELAINRGRLDNGDLRALLVLTGLKSLFLDGSCITEEVVPELVALRNLRKLILSNCEVTSLEPVTRVLNPLHEARGWPPMYVCHSKW